MLTCVVRDKNYKSQHDGNVLIDLPQIPTTTTARNVTFVVSGGGGGGGSTNTFFFNISIFFFRGFILDNCCGWDRCRLAIRWRLSLSRAINARRRFRPDPVSGRWHFQLVLAEIKSEVFNWFTVPISQPSNLWWTEFESVEGGLWSSEKLWRA